MAKKGKRDILKIGTKEVALGETQDVKLKVSESYTGHPIFIRLRVIRGPKKGPTIFICAAIHGDELNGTGIVREIMLSDLKLKKGTLICIPVVNVFGLENHSRYLPDRRDLNRCFPGSKTGTMADRFAYTVFKKIVSKCDYGIDLHTAAIRRTNFPNIRADLNTKGIEDIAYSFGCEIVINKAGPEKSLRNEACAGGCPTIIYEAGEVLKFEPTVVSLGKRGILNVLKSLKMIEGAPVQPVYQSVVEKTSWIRAEHGGLLRFHVRPGDLIKKGGKIATCKGLFTEEGHDVIAPQDGIVLGMTTIPAIKPGEPVCHLAYPTKSLSQIKDEIKASPKTLHRKLQKELAKNFKLER